MPHPLSSRGFERSQGQDRKNPMRPTRLSSTFCASTAIAGLASGVALLAAPVPARAGDDEPAPSIDQKVMRGIMEGLGLKRDGEATINYQERAPLVIPP